MSNARRIVITSGKGGVGKSTVAVGLASALVRLSQRVLLIDCDAGLRSLDIMLGEEDKVAFDLGDVLCGRCEFDAAVLPVSGVEGLWFVPAPATVDDFVCGGALRVLSDDGFISSISRNYDYVIIDCPAGLDSGFYTSLALANEALVVAAPGRVSLRDAFNVGVLIEERGISSVRLVINRLVLDRRRFSLPMDLDEMIDATGIRLIAAIPEDDAMFDFDINKISKKSEASAAFDRLACRVCGEYVPFFIRRKY